LHQFRRQGLAFTDANDRQQIREHQPAAFKALLEIESKQP
jgi:hypothetical protein